MSINNLFNISRKGLATYQRALNTTANNITNASNPDYSRQRVSITSDPSVIKNGFEWGTGVDGGMVVRVRDSFVEKSIIENTSGYNYHSTRETVLSRLESHFSEPSDNGISAMMNSFFSTWQELSVNPSSIPLRNNVLNAAEKLAAKINTVDNDINNVKAAVENDFRSKIDELNDKLIKVNDLNKKILSSQSQGAKSNQLLDERDRLIGEMSELADIKADINSNGTANVYINGTLAADVNGYETFTFARQGNEIHLMLEGDKVSVKGGEMGALVDLNNNDINDITSEFHSFVENLANEVNALHSSGYTAEETPRTGIGFFDLDGENLISLNDILRNNPQAVAVSSDGTDGNGDIALTMADLATQDISAGKSLNEMYTNLISGIGSKTSTASQNAEASALVLDHMEEFRQSQSGVSIDEEMTDMITYQRSYEASARVARMADQMFQTILDLL